MLLQGLTKEMALEAAQLTITNPQFREFTQQGIIKAFDEGDTSMLWHAMNLHSYPVDIEEFMFGDRFLRRPKDELYPAVVEELWNINEKHGRVINTLTEGVFTGGIGSAKTTTALYTNAYQLYVLSCYKNPHKAFKMDSTSEILFIFQSMNATLSKEVDYTRFKAICEQSYYFTSVFPFDKHLVSSLKFPNRIEAKPIASDGGAIGQNVMGGLIDEVNFMAVIEDSKKSSTRGTYDQAKAIYDSVSRRIKTRFVNNGGMPGILCLVSSKNYPGEFTDTKLAEAVTDPSIYIYDKRVWDVKPKGTFSGETFKIFTGDETRKARFILEKEDVAKEDEPLLMDIPVEFRKSFENDMIGSLRDIAGVSTMARYPYFQNSEAVIKCFGAVKSILTKEEHDFNDSNPLSALPERIIRPDLPRWVHVDLAITGDAAGVSCGYCPGFTKLNSELDEYVPRINFDFVLRVLPPKGGEIKFFKIRELLMKLRELGLPIKWVTFDSFQSVDSVQLLRQQGFQTGYISVDTSMLPYMMMKDGIYDGRIQAPKHHVAQKEVQSLERIAQKNKIDHPPTGSKDCSDSMAGVIYGLSTRKEVWVQHGIPIAKAPMSYMETLKNPPKHGAKSD